VATYSLSDIALLSQLVVYVDRLHIMTKSGSTILTFVWKSGIDCDRQL